MDGDNFRVRETKMSTILKTAPLGSAGLSRQALGSPNHWRHVARRIVLLQVRLLILWQKRIRDRETLSNMSPYQLKDIGIGQIESLQESEKPFWRG
jgi:uncharacterized protein YjiS (DUF1127 family)